MVAVTSAAFLAQVQVDLVDLEFPVVPVELVAWVVPVVHPMYTVTRDLVIPMTRVKVVMIRVTAVTPTAVEPATAQDLTTVLVEQAPQITVPDLVQASVLQALARSVEPVVPVVPAVPVDSEAPVQLEVLDPVDQVASAVPVELVELVMSTVTPAQAQALDIQTRVAMVTPMVEQDMAPAQAQTTVWVEQEQVPQITAQAPARASVQ